MVEWLVYSGIGGKGTITSALNGGDVKRAIFSGNCRVLTFLFLSQQA